jgi:NADPH-dependent 2,4-dienoyl-CoA reductase/sulfur reductase-like enzyme
MQRITVPHRDSLQRGRFVEGNIIEATKDKIVVDSETLNYDYLVIATGSNYRSNIKQSYVTKKDRMNGRTTLMGDVALKIKRAEHIVIAGSVLMKKLPTCLVGC